MTKDKDTKKYDLEDRTAKFGVVAVPKLKEEAKPMWREAKELNLIFNSIYKEVK